MTGRFLSEEEVPEQERKRRATIRHTVLFLEAEVENRWKQIDETLERNKREGVENDEAALRQQAYLETAGMFVAIQRLQQELPPYLEMTEDLQLVERFRLSRYS